MLTIVAAPLPRIQLATGVPVTVPVVEDKDEAAFFVVGAKKSEWNKLHKLKSKRQIFVPILVVLATKPC